MSYGGLNARQAANEHALAVTRDFISQPRLSKFFEKIFIIIFSHDLESRIKDFDDLYYLKGRKFALNLHVL